MADYQFPATEMGFFSLPTAVVDAFLNDADESTLKVLLFLARHTEGFDKNEALKKLSVSPASFDRAIAFWLNKGILTENERGVILNPECFLPKTGAEKLSHPAKAEVDFAEIAKAAETDAGFQNLLQSVQGRFSKPLTQSAVKTLYGFYQFYGFSTEVIFALICYCTGNGHENFKYIEQVAEDWYQKGVRSEEDAARLIAESKRKQDAEFVAKRVLGIGERNFTSKEKKCIAHWFEGLGFGEEMLNAAFERCVAATGKLNFTYMDKILQKWSDAGIKTAEEADKADEQFAEKKPKKGKSKAPIAGETTHNVSDFADWSFNTLYADKKEDK